MNVIARVAVVVTLAIVAAPDDSWAGRGRGSGHRSGARSGPVHHHPHHQHFHGSFFLGAPFWYPRPYSYYDYAYPPVYVEQYVGEPTPDTRDVIFCPNRNAYYPDATDCPGGWARVIPPG